MSDLLEIPLIADRGVPFTSDSIEFLGENWASATLRMQVRDIYDGEGPAKVSLSGGAGVFLAYAGSMTIAAHITAGRLSPDLYDVEKDNSGAKYLPGDTVAVSVVFFGIGADAMRGPPDGLIPFPSELGDDWEGVWDLLVDPDGGGSGNEIKVARGPFIVRGTSTQ